MDWICRWLELHRWFHPWSNLKQLWCNPFCIKEKKKKKQQNTGYGSWFSLLLIMNALYVQSVATVPSLFFGPEWSRDSVFCFCSCFFYYYYYFILTLDYIDHVVQANFLQKKDTKKKSMENTFKLFCAIKVICRFFFN